MFVTAAQCALLNLLPSLEVCEHLNAHKINFSTCENCKVYFETCNSFTSLLFKALVSEFCQPVYVGTSNS